MKMRELIDLMEQARMQNYLNLLEQAKTYEEFKEIIREAELTV